MFQLKSFVPPPEPRNMAIKAQIHCFPEGSCGWIQVDPFDYEYTGPDPDGEVEAYLNGVATGEIKFHHGMEIDYDDSEYPPELKLMEIKNVLPSREGIWFIELPDDFENPITYG